MKWRPSVYGIVGFIFVSMLGGCASVTVKDVQRNGEKERVPRPAVFVVENFGVDSGRVKENPMRKHPGKLAEESQTLLHGFLVEELKKTGVPVVTGGTRGAGNNAWVVSGTITRVAEGNRLLRMGIGLGAGGTKMETQVAVRAGKVPVLNFNTTGGSGATPGGATMPIPFSGVPTALMNSKDGVTADAARTARMIAATIAQYLSQQGWLQGEWEKPKMGRG
jgi:hypothetical protein